MSQHQPDAVVERFPPTSGRFSGILGLAAAAVVFTLAVVARSTGVALGVAILACLGAIMCWSILLRPALWVTAGDLVMRGMFSTLRIPLAAIDSVIVTQVFAVKAGERRYVSPVIGHTVRQTMRAKMRDGRRPTGDAPASTDNHQAFVEARVAHLAQDTRERLGIRKGSPEQQALAADVRRTWARPELAGIALAVLAFLVWLVA